VEGGGEAAEVCHHPAARVGADRDLPAVETAPDRPRIIAWIASAGPIAEVVFSQAADRDGEFEWEDHLAAGAVLRTTCGLGREAQRKSPGQRAKAHHHSESSLDSMLRRCSRAQCSQ
jgi:hypothetical protein